jgi:hypothetical protein
MIAFFVYDDSLLLVSLYRMNKLAHVAYGETAILDLPDMTMPGRLKSSTNIRLKNS